MANLLTVNVITRGGNSLSDVIAYQLVSASAAGSLFGYRSMSVDTAAGTGIKVLTAEIVNTSSGGGSVQMTLQGSGGATIQSFLLEGQLNPATTTWFLQENFNPTNNNYAFSAIKQSGSLPANTLLGQLSLALPNSATNTTVLNMNNAELTIGSQATVSPARDLVFTQANLGATGQLNATIENSNVGVSFERGTGDFLINGTLKPVTAADALDALKLSVGLAASKGSSWRELISADINNSGTVTAADALEILRISVGVNTIQPRWVFVPEDAGINPNLATMDRNAVTYKNDYNLSSLTAPTTATVTAILVGDVNNSWVASTGGGTDTTPPVAPGLALASDTGATNFDGITSVGTLNVTALEVGATWQYSINGAAFVTGSGSSFALPAGTYGPGAIQVKQTDAAGNVGPTGTNAAAITVDNTPPTFSSATVNGNTLVLSYNGQLDATNAAVLGGFSVTVAGQGQVSIVAAATAGSQVTLTLAAPVTSGNTVTVSYTEPSGSDDTFAIQDIAGNDAVSLVNQAVANNTPGGGGDTTAPVLLANNGAVVNGATVVLTYDEPLDPAHQPSASYFAFSMLNPSTNTTTGRTINALSISGSTVTLTLSGPVATTDVVTMIYVDPSASNDAFAIQDVAGNDAASLGSTATPMAVTNQTAADVPPLRINGVTFSTTATNSLVLNFNEVLHASSDATGMTITLNGSTPVTINSATPSGTALTIATGTTFVSTDYVTVSYNGAGTIKDTAATPNFLTSFANIGGNGGANTINASNDTAAVTIRGNGGNDTLTGSNFGDSLIAGGGADVLNGGPGNDSHSIGEGTGTRSLDTVIVGSNQSTVVSFDTIFGFDINSAATPTSTNDQLNLPSGAIAPNTAGLVDGATNTTANLTTPTVTTVTFDKHSIANGIITFYDTANAPIAINSGNSAALRGAAMSYLSANLTTPGTTVAFAYDNDNSGQSDSLVVFQDGVAPNSDLMVQLTGTNGATLGNDPGLNVVQIVDNTAPFMVSASFTPGTGTYTRVLSENVQLLSGTESTIVLNATSGPNIVTNASVAGNVRSFQTSANFSPTDWVFFTTGDRGADFAATPNRPAIGNLGATGGDGDNVMNLSAISVAGPSGSVRIEGNGGNDVIIGSGGNDQITGGTGADIMNGGTGADQFRFSQGDSTAVTANLGGDSVLNSGDTFSFPGGLADRVNGAFDMTGPNGDRISFIPQPNLPGLANIAAPTTGIVGNQQYFMVQGNYNTAAGTFEVNTATGMDTLVVYDGDASGITSQTALVINARTPAGLTVSGGNLYANTATTDLISPTLVNAAVNSTQLVLTFSESMGGDAFGPPANATQVLVNGTPNTVVNGVTNDRTVTLTLQTAVLAGQTVTFSYTDPSAGNDTFAAQDLAGNDSPSVTNFPVTNSSTGGGDTTAPVLLANNGAVVNGATVVLTYDEPLDPAHQPSASYFAFSMLNPSTNTTTGRTINALSISGSTVTLTLSGPVATTDVVTMIYVDPSASNDAFAIQDVAGNDAASLGSTATPMAVTNQTAADVPPLRINGVTFSTTATNSLVLNFNEVLHASSDATGMTITLNGSTPVTINSATPSGTALTIATGTTFVSTDYVTVSYNGAGTIKDTAATPNFLTSFANIGGNGGANTINASNDTAAVTIRGNGGNDTLTGSNFGDSLIAGGGADVLNGGPGNDSHSIGEGTGTRSLDTVIVGSNQSTVVSFDTIFGFDINSAATPTSTNDQLNLPSGAIAPNTAGLVDGATNTTANLTTPTVTTVTFDKHSIANGIITFYDTANAPIAINSGNSAALRGAAMSYLSANLTTPGTTVAFAYDNDNSGQSDSLVVFQDGVAPNSDLMVQLTGTNGATLGNDPGLNVVQIVDNTAPFMVSASFTPGTGTYTRVLSENVQLLSGTESTIVLNATSGPNIVTNASVAGNVRSFQTSANFSPTDWVFFTTGDRGADFAATPNRPAIGNLGATGGDGDNVMNLSAISVAGPSGSVRIEGNGGNDVIIGSGGNDQITGGTGADIMNGGTGADQFRFSQGDSTAVTANLGGDSVLNSGDTFSFPGGLADRVNGAFDMTGPNGDRISFIPQPNLPGLANIAAPTTGIVGNQQYFMVQGNYNTAAGTFEVNTATGMDTLVVYDGDASGITSQTALVINARTPAGLTVSGGNLYANTATTDLISPTLVNAAVNSTQLVLTFSESMGGDAFGPPANATQVLVNGTPNTVVNGVTNDRTVTLTLQTAVLAGQTVTFSYTDPSAGNDTFAAQDLAGNDSPSVTNFPVTNSSTGGGDTTAPVLLANNGAVVNGATVVLTYDEPLDPAHQPSASYFAFSMLNPSTNTTTGRTINALSISGSTVTLTLSGPVATTDVVTMIYVDPSASNDAFAIQDVAGNDAASLGSTATPMAVTNQTAADVPPLRINGVTFSTTATNSLVLNFNEVLHASSDATGMTITLNGSTPVTINSATPSGTALTIATGTTFVSTDYVTVSYNGAGTIKDTAATPNFLTSFANIGGNGGANTINASNDTAAVTIRGNGGNDTLTGSNFGDSLIAGGGADVLNGGPGNDSHSIGEGTGTRSLDTVIVGSNQSTVVSFDTIFGFDINSAATPTSTNDQLNLPSGAIAPNTAGLVDGATNTTANLTTPTVTTVTFDKHSIANGIITFYDTANAPIAINSGNSAALRGAAMSYLSANLTTPGTTVAFAYDNDNSGQSDSLVVFQDGVAPNSDLMVQLTGTNGATLGNDPGLNVVQIVDNTAPFMVSASFTPGTGTYTRVLSENVQLLSGTESTIVLNATSGPNIVTNASVAGNVRSFQTSANFSPTDWVFFTTGDRGADFAATPNRPAIGNLGATGGDGDNVMNLSAISVAGPSGSVRIEGNGGNDVIIGSGGNDQITGGTGADIMNGGTGADQFRFSQGDSTAVTANLGGDSVLNSGDTFSFPGGLADRVNGAFDMTGPNGDRISFIPQPNLPGLANIAAPTTGIVGNQQYFMVQGNYNTAAGTFEVNTATGMDTLVVYDGDASGITSQTALVINARTPAGLTVSGGNLYANTATTDLISPTLVNAAVNSTQLVLTFSESMGGDAFGPPANATQVLVNGTPNTVVNGVTNDRTVTLTLQTAVLAGQTVTFSYTDPSAGNDTFAAQDLAGNDSPSVTNFPVTNSSTGGGDTTPPTVTIGTNDFALKSGDVALLSFTLSEASTNFTMSDVTVTGGALSNFTGSGTFYTANFTPNSNSTTSATVNVFAGTFTDAANNNNLAATQLSMSVDTAIPSNAGSSYTNVTGASSTVVFGFTEAVSGNGTQGLSLTVNPNINDGFTGTSLSFTSQGAFSNVTALNLATANTTLDGSQVIRLRYDASQGAGIEDAAGNALPSMEVFIGGSVTSGTLGNNIINLEEYNNYNSSFQLFLRGNGGADTLIGNWANNVLLDGGGTDTMFGGRGGDNFVMTENGTNSAYAKDIVRIGRGDSPRGGSGISDAITPSSSNAGSGFDTFSTTLANHDVLDLQAKLIAGNVSNADGTDVGSIAKHSIASGIVTFQDTAGNAIAITQATNLGSALDYLSLNIMAAGTTVAFRGDSDNNGSVDSLYVWQDMGTVPIMNNYAVQDMVVRIGYDINVNASALANVVLGLSAAANTLQLQDTFGPEPLTNVVTGTDGFRLNFSEIAYIPTGVAMTMQVNGSGNLFTPSSVDGSGTTDITIHFAGAGMGATDWALFNYNAAIPGNAITDGPGGTGNALLADPGGDIFAVGSDGNNAMNLAAFGGGLDIEGRGGNDTITGSSFDDFITGGTGADLMSGGAGIDEFDFEQGDSPLVTARNLGVDNLMNNGDTFSFAGGVDRITGFANGEKIFIQSTLGEASGLAGVGRMQNTPTDGLATNQAFFTVRGNFAGSDFTVSDTGVDTLVVYDGDASSAVSQTAFVISGVNPGQLQTFFGSNTITGMNIIV